MYNDKFDIFESMDCGWADYSKDNLILLNHDIYYFEDDNRYHLFKRNIFDGQEEFDYRASVNKKDLANWVDALVMLQNLPDPSKSG